VSEILVPGVLGATKTPGFENFITSCKPIPFLPCPLNAILRESKEVRFTVVKNVRQSLRSHTMYSLSLGRAPVVAHYPKALPYLFKATLFGCYYITVYILSQQNSFVNSFYKFFEKYGKENKK
jgi:hypothetical protein